MQAHIFISGFVQGVGFRQFVKWKGRKFGLKGWVKNLPDARVEAILQGPREVIEKMLKEVRKGPFLSEVEEVLVEWSLGEDNLDTFEVIK